MVSNMNNSKIIFQLTNKNVQTVSMEWFGQRDIKSSVDPNLMHKNLNSSESEDKIKGAYPKMSGLSENSQFQLLTPYKMFGGRNASRNQQYDMGCKCGLGKMGEVRKNESRIVNGYEPEKRPWMVNIEVNIWEKT